MKKKVEFVGGVVILAAGVGTAVAIAGVVFPFLGVCNLLERKLGYR